MTAHGHLYDTDLNIIWPKVWASLHHIIPSLYWPHTLSCIFYWLYAATLSRVGRIPVFVKRTWTVLAPWSSLTSYSGRRAYYGIVCYIILHYIMGTDPVFGTWPSVTIHLNIIYPKVWPSLYRHYTIPILAIYVELYILFFFLCSLHWPGRAAYLFLHKRTGLSFPLEVV